ncbi:hypothetical protein LOTGIDRAFT_239470 [Lottia gigantea]|uniref:VWFA domain-containing protein n=1 Tax=Lottia gigantea TaxID=225164 RepID=V4AJN5_LOTGI|nr:hypothetical protein LOTGIDRAFT_239470 [Lottia gigantea]ESO94915.1 hypothetical protein LOTGIDRAFT_239470 [Lottia gigantea]
MNFGSDKVYLYKDVEYEYVSDEEYDEGLNVSDDESDGERVAQPEVPRKRFGSGLKKFFGKSSKSKSRDKKHHWQTEADNESDPQSRQKFNRANTNVISIRLGVLKDPCNMHAGDAIRCQGQDCPAVMSNISKLTSGMSGKVWVCEFCGTNNEVDVEEGEIPKDDDVTFLLEASPAAEAAGPSGVDESIVVFCIDVSGSMCVSTEVQGKPKLRSSSVRNAAKLNPTGEDQYLPNQKRNVTYVSRLQSMQAAVDKQLEDMVKESPNRRVAIISFNNELRVMDEGVNTDQIIAGKKLEDEAELTRLGSEIQLPKPIKDTHKALTEKIYNLEEMGQTALGPALVVAMGLASRHVGSKIVICTDGLANVGLGRLDEGTSEECGKFYEEMAVKANDKGVSISVVSIKGAESKVVQLGKLAEITNGQVNHVDPLKLTEEFSNILADRTIATNVKSTVLLHKNLKFSDEDTESNVIRKYIGNATVDTVITYQYEPRLAQGAHSSSEETQKDAKKVTDKETEIVSETDPQGSSKMVTNPVSSTCMPGTSTEPIPSKLPFQLQLEYTDVDGTKALRVFMRVLDVTTDRKEAERNINLEVLGVHTAKTCADLALQGEYTQSRGVAFMSHRLAWRNTRESAPVQRRNVYKKMFHNLKVADAHVSHAQKTEISKYGRSHSDSEGEDEVDFVGGSKECCEMPADRPLPPLGAAAPPLGASASRGKKMKKKAKRSEEVPDDMASEIYALKQARMSDLLS